MKRNMKRSKLSNRRNANRKNQNKMVIYKNIGRFTADRLKCRLLYNDTTTSRTHTASNAANWAYRSSAYDPDPTLGSGAIPGFVELANLYAKYLVHSMTLNLEIANQEPNAQILGVWPSNVYQTVNSLLASDIQEYSSNPGGQRRIMAAVSGMDITKITCRAVGTKLFGRQFLTDEQFASSSSSNPATMYGINIGFFLGNGTTAAYPCIVSASVIYEVEFFALRQLES